MPHPGTDTIGAMQRPAATRVLLLLLATRSPGQESPTAPPAPTPSATAEQRLRDWREDLAFLAAELPARHKNAFYRCSKEDFTAAVAALDRDLEHLADHQIVVRLMQLVAMVHDFHTGIGIDALPRPSARLPLALGLFADGPVVVGAREGQKDLIGCRLVRFDALPIEEALRRAASVVGYENEATFRHMAPRLLAMGPIAHALGMSERPDAATITVQGADGGERTVDLTALRADEALAAGGPQADGLPLYRQQRATANWYEPLPQQHAVYVHYWRCADDTNQRVADLCEDVLEAVEAPGVQRVVVDLRGNGGGNSALLSPLIARLGSRENLKAPGAVIALVGRGTFSSAQMNAVALRQDAHAVLIGEPTGQKPNSYGEVKSFALPHSRIAVRYSTKFWKTESGDAESTAPDVTIVPTSADFLAGRDPVLDAALAYAPK